jgi:NitT/TauT family transport system substrate-binding protein
MSWTPTTRRRHLSASPLLALAVLLAACAPAATPGATGSAPPSAPAAPPAATAAPASQPVAQAPAPPRETAKLVQAIPSRDFGYLAAFVAAGRGFFAEEGLEVELPVMNSNAAIPAISNKQVHLAASGSGSRAAYQGAPLRAIYTAHNKVTFLAVGTPEVRSYRDLVGKTIAIASPGSSEDWISKSILQREGIPLSDVQILPLGQGPQRVQAMVAGQAHFSALNPDLAVDLERKGYNILGHLGEFMPIPWGGFVAHVDVIRDEPEVLKRWIRASIRALQFTKRNPAEAAEIAVRDLGIDPQVAPRAVELMLPSISDEDPGGVTEAAITFVTQFDMEALGMSGDPAEIGKRVYDMALLRQVQREMGIRCTTGYQCQ